MFSLKSAHLLQSDKNSIFPTNKINSFLLISYFRRFNSLLHIALFSLFGQNVINDFEKMQPIETLSMSTKRNCFRVRRIISASATKSPTARRLKEMRVLYALPTTFSSIFLGSDLPGEQSQEQLFMLR